MYPWTLALADGFERRLTRLRRRHTEAVDDAMLNVAKYHERYLCQLGYPRSFTQPGFVHIEPQGLLAIDQGHRPYRTQIRIYVYPEVDTLTLWLVQAGDKRLQNADIAYCIHWLARTRLLP
jgi:hypothetical protein